MTPNYGAAPMVTRIIEILANHVVVDYNTVCINNEFFCLFVYNTISILS